MQLRRAPNVATPAGPPGKAGADYIYFHVYFCQLCAKLQGQAV